MALLMSPVLNRLIAFGFNLFKKPAPERQISFKSLGLATLLAVIAWRIAGIQIWLLAYGFGMDLSISNMALSIGAYALAWVAGFLVVFVPAGTGVREGVLGLLFAGSLSPGGILAVVLVSHITMTFADLAFAGAGALLRTSNKR
ncbi:lysylphosphatidylglycerol synthase domain-containing protein [Bifidobacterium pseudocatenulatum]|uniref:lysylphosphatidylglycerol synthase domain-containing protein n=1 Tax=Bifidobacterium pseudocatenulatum TaxID=28026 RepID=UPI00385763E6